MITTLSTTFKYIYFPLPWFWEREHTNQHLPRGANLTLRDGGGELTPFKNHLAPKLEGPQGSLNYQRKQCTFVRNFRNSLKIIIEIAWFDPLTLVLGNFSWLYGAQPFPRIWKNPHKHRFTWPRAKRPIETCLLQQPYGLRDKNVTWRDVTCP